MKIFAVSLFAWKNRAPQGIFIFKIQKLFILIVPKLFAIIFEALIPKWKLKLEMNLLNYTINHYNLMNMNSNSRQAASSRQNTVCLCTVHVAVECRSYNSIWMFLRIALIYARIMEQRKFVQWMAETTSMTMTTTTT